MRIVHRTELGDALVELEVSDPLATAADLLAALGGTDLTIDGQSIAGSVSLADIVVCEGSVLETGARAEESESRAAERELAVVGGLWAGTSHSLAFGEEGSVGRGSSMRITLDDPTVSAHHLTISGDSLRDHRSRNGTSIEGHRVVTDERTDIDFDRVVRMGASRVALRRTVDDCPVAIASALGAVGGTIPFNRPPRPAPPMEPASLVVPAEPEPLASTEPLSVAGIVLPILVGVVVALLLSPLMAIFAALGPVLTIGTWWERRRRNRKVRRTAVRQLRLDMAQLDKLLPDARLNEMRRRRTLIPDPAEVIRRAEALSVRCWERRRADTDAFAVGIGACDEAFAPTLVVDGSSGDEAATDAVALVASLALMPDLPMVVDLSPGRTVGLVGDRRAAIAIARCLVMQIGTHHGPADIAVVVGADDPDEWDWCRWLPHTADHVSGRRGATVMTTTDVATLDSFLVSCGDRTTLAVLDGDDPFQGRTTVGRRLLDHQQTSAIVLVPDAHRLPAGCDIVVVVDEVGRIEVIDPRRPGQGRGGLAWGMGLDIATSAAMRLARLDDPELPLVGADVPSTAALLDLLGLTGDDSDEIDRRWALTHGTADLVVPIGADGLGPVLLDLVADGPHVLIGGTTGSGKSELLRSLVAGAAATADPDHLAVVLIDYKGGAAFDCCADLPHVAGLVTDLDDDLAQRALRCLDAELRYREHRLRDLGAEDLAMFRSLAAGRDDVEPLPRLLVVVDEFASLAADLPEFLDALVGIAQRGRSLGVHLVLATQRPAGVVTDDIRANAPCRIALRVTDRHDSVDVIGEPDAASIPRSRPGRAVARFGPGELVPFQSALSTGRSRGRPSIVVRGATSPPEPEPEGPSDLRRLVDTINTAHRRAEGSVPRPPWPPALPTRLLRSDAGDPDGWMLVDRPDEQRQSFERWTPADGHLVVVGGPGCGSTTTLAHAALDAISLGGDEAPHVHVIDLDGGDLCALDSLAHVGTVVGPADEERRSRLLRWLDREVATRRAKPDESFPGLLLVVDDFGGLARAHDPVRDSATHDRVERLWADGPSVGVTFVVSAKRAADLTPAMAATAGTVLLHRCGDQADTLRFGVNASTDGFAPGRVIRAADEATLHIVTNGLTLVKAIASQQSVDPPSRQPHQVGELASVIPSSPELISSTFGPDLAEFTFAIRDCDLAPATMTLHRGEHCLVVGPPRSGRTNMLALLADSCPGDHVVIGDGELARRLGVDVVKPCDLVAALGGRPGIVLVDDCLDVDDPTGVLAQMVAAPPSGVHLVVSARPDRYRAAYGHWSGDIRGSRVGVLLRPEAIDGDLLGVSLPARLSLPRVAGRGVLVADGEADVIQVMHASDPRATIRM